MASVYALAGQQLVAVPLVDENPVVDLLVVDVFPVVDDLREVADDLEVDASQVVDGDAADDR